MLFTWCSFPPTSDNPASLIPSRHPTRPICAHPPHILLPTSHTITHLTSLSPFPPPKSPPSSHFAGTQQDLTQQLFRGRKRVRVASYVSIGRSPISFFPLSTSSTSLHIDYPPRTRYLFLSSQRTNALPLRPLRGRGVISSWYTGTMVDGKDPTVPQPPVVMHSLTINIKLNNTYFSVLSFRHCN